MAAVVPVFLIAAWVAMAGPARRAASPINGTLYVGLQNYDGQVAVVDLQSSRLVKTISLGSRPLQLAASRDGQRVYVVSDNSIITVIDAVQREVSDRLMIDGRPGGHWQQPGAGQDLLS